MTSITIPMSELLNTDGFENRLVIITTATEPVTARIIAVEPSKNGRFDLLTEDISGEIQLVENKFVHEIEDMLVGDCGCDECKEFGK